jgi:predicted nucleic acid-binding protein
VKVIADTNIFLAVVLNEPEKSNIIELTSGFELLAPEILPFEIGNAISAMMKKRIITAEEANLIWDASRQISVELSTVDIKEALNIAIEHNIYAYDAYFLQCAVNNKCPLITLDRKMKEIGKSLKIKILE